MASAGTPRYDTIGQDYTAFQGWSAWLAQFTALLPALIGIGLGRNPSGFLNDAFEQYGNMIREARSLFLAGVAAELLLWFLAFRRVIDNWVFAILTGALVVLLPRLVAIAGPGGIRRDAAADGESAVTPLELVGIDRAFTAADLREINRGIGIDGHIGFDRLRT